MVMARWKEFVRFMVAHWIEVGLYDDVAAIEIWNEPNFWKYWGYPGGTSARSWEPKPGRYADVFRHARLGMRDATADPVGQVDIISGGLLPVNQPPSGSNQIQDAVFMDKFIKNLPSTRYPDGIGVHAYANKSANPVANVEADYDRISDAVRGSNAKGTPRWITEWGYPSKPFGQTEEVNQAKVMRDTFEALYARSTPPSSMVVHRLVDYTEPIPGPGGPEDGDSLEKRLMGTVRTDRSRKPSFCLLAVKVGMPNPTMCESRDP